MRVRRRGVRRTFQISVTRDAERDTEHDIKIRQRATDLHWKGDNIVAHNKNTGKNIEIKLGATGGGAYHWFGESDASALREWEAFVAAKTAFNFEALAQLLRRDGSIALPARFPKSEEADGMFGSLAKSFSAKDRALVLHRRQLDKGLLGGHQMS